MESGWMNGKSTGVVVAFGTWYTDETYGYWKWREGKTEWSIWWLSREIGLYWWNYDKLNEVVTCNRWWRSVPLDFGLAQDWKKEGFRKWPKGKTSTKENLRPRDPYHGSRGWLGGYRRIFTVGAGAEAHKRRLKDQKCLGLCGTEEEKSDSLRMWEPIPYLRYDISLY